LHAPQNNINKKSEKVVPVLMEERDLRKNGKWGLCVDIYLEETKVNNFQQIFKIQNKTKLPMHFCPRSLPLAL
jgi:hypothetical protein